jgi:hypothetical protein
MREATARGPSIDISEFERRLRNSEPKEAPPAAADPLAELARLLHAEEGAAQQQDPYRRMFATEQRPVEPQPVAEPQPFAAGLRGTLPPLDEAEQNASYYHPADPEAAYADADWGHPEAQDYLDYGVDPDEPVEEAQEQPRGFFSTLRSRLKPWHAVAGVATLGAVSVGMVFGHRSGVVAPTEIATIRAPEGPAKVQPHEVVAEAAAPKPGATILDRSQSAPVKQVVSNQEQPVDPAAAVRVVRLGDGPVDAPHQPPKGGSPYGSEPKRVKTVSVRPDGTVIERDAPAPAIARPAPPARQPAPAQAAADRGAPPDTATATPKAAVKPATTPKVATPPRPKIEKPAAKPADQTASVAPPTAPEPAAALAAGGFAVQFGAAASEAEARKMIQDVSAKFGAQLGGRRPAFQFAKVGDKSVYRVRAAGMSREAAVGVCEKVKASGGKCFVAGN